MTVDFNAKSLFHRLKLWLGAALITRLKLPFHYAKLGTLILQCKFLLLWAAVRNGFRTKRVLTVPDKPPPWSAFYKICHLLGYRVTSDIDAPADLVFAWQDRTVREPCPSLDRLAQRRPVVNYECRDISKREVAAAFEQVFGYGLAVNPAEHHGPMVRKHRFTNEFGTGVIHRTSDVLSAIELDLVLQFCRAIGLDYGELDIVRDQEDGRIYIVDANNTPFGPLTRDIQVRWYFDRQSWRALKYLAGAFRAAFVNQRGVEIRSS